MIIKIKELKISWNYFKNKILAIKKVKKTLQNKEKKKKTLINIYFNKEVIQKLIINLRIYI